MVNSVAPSGSGEGLTYGPSAAPGKFDCSEPRSSPSSGANPATYTSPTTLSVTPAALMTAPPYEWPTSSTGPLT